MVMPLTEIDDKELGQFNKEVVLNKCFISI